LILTAITQAAGARRYASTAPAAKKQSNLPYLLLGVGVAGMGGYWYLESNKKTLAVKQEKSPLDPENFIDFKLKKVERYNHNTSKYVSAFFPSNHYPRTPPQVHL
jgi:cytochrome-b5 reductase